MKLPRSAVKIGIVAGLLGGATGVAVAVGLAPSPAPSVGTFQPIAEERAFAETKTVDAAGAGTVTYRIDGATLSVIDATPAAGSTIEVEQATGREIEVDFRSATQRVQVNVEFEDGVARERVRTRAVDDGTTSTSLSPSTSVRDDDRRDDRRGDDDDDGGHHRGRGGDDDDRDDDDDDEDRSGSNSGHG